MAWIALWALASWSLDAAAGCLGCCTEPAAAGPAAGVESSPVHPCHGAEADPTPVGTADLGADPAPRMACGCPGEGMASVPASSGGHAPPPAAPARASHASPGGERRIARPDALTLPWISVHHDRNPPLLN